METSGNIAEGNTRPPRIVPSPYWCFTLNNYSEEEVEDLKNGNIGNIVWGYEIGENETPHLQGYVEFTVKTRPNEKIKNKRIHWEKRKGTRKQAFDYCIKDGNYYQHGFDDLIEEEYKPMKGLLWKNWQIGLLEVIHRKKIDRKIMWFWEEKGNVGKTTFAYHICKNYNAIYLSGKSNDIKSAIASCKKKPEICIFDFTRSLENFVSYEGIESVKNGIFFNGKYESGMVMNKPPIVICFANFKPDYNKLSNDRWIITKL